MTGTPTTAPVPLAPLPPLSAQADRLIGLGLHTHAGLPAEEVRSFAERHSSAGRDTLLALHPDRVPASVLAPLLRHAGKPGFVVTDMQDVDRFTPQGIDLPDAPLYTVTGIDRGDHLANWSPEEALPALTGEGRTPLLLSEGMHWVLQQPEALERNRCFMTIGSRLRKPNGKFDARTPALWISNGTGRDGRDRRDAPKAGWCWWGNRHTWLGFASTTGRAM
ncbi:hypothetical protein G3I31_33915 [Streptomyces sp. SID9913]|uniref:Uncharacterized protein n=2 Tax=unclassified Streptomyces TaxID=2593676 RepID=A0A6G3QSA1_9ACTN|nr:MULTISPECIES: DUF5701 family protein [unclassified Streptomyces]MBM7091358.1 hypothetical protein [Streptomyces sp. S12]NEA86225.1 hypothetical protein [Streptomyces sp. SID14436]NEC81891.1 hypothetical protein [Streptomyces sp. SID7958]NED22967.1 hypothetical protein [Streptomyces sp. SID9913]